MFLEADDVGRGELETDVCIIGGGPAGITIARELKGSDLDVMLLESGGREVDAGSRRLNEGRNVGFPYFPLVNTRLRAFGGASGHWGGACWPLEPIDLEARDWVPHSGWPVDYRTLEPWYLPAQAICGVGPFEYDAGYWSERANLPLLNLDNDTIVTKLFQNSSPPRHFGRHFGPDLDDATNVRTVLHATVTRLELDRSAPRLASATVARPSGRALSVRARVFVLAAGGLENPRLLLLSDDVQGTGLGNGEDQVGRYFMEHLFINAGAVLLLRQGSVLLYGVQRIDGTVVRAGLGLAAAALRRERILNSWIGLGLGGQPPNPGGDDGSADPAAEARLATDVMALAGDIDLAESAVTESYHHLSITSHAEQSPNPDSRVTLDDERDALGLRRVRLDWRLTELDHRSARRGLELLGVRLGARAAGRLQTRMEAADDVWVRPPAEVGASGPFGSYHHMGTTRMSASPRQGVVDGDCRIHGIANAYIAGSSVFPTCGFVNPTLTIVALACRLADHLKRELALS